LSFRTRLAVAIAGRAAVRRTVNETDAPDLLAHVSWSFIRNRSSRHLHPAAGSAIFNE
jgi:hypothetical protein